MRIFTLYTICLVFIFTNSYGQAHKNSIKKEAESMLIDFYTNYITVFATEPPGLSSQKKLEVLQKLYCTEELFKKIPFIVEQTDADPFLKAQDCDINWLQTLNIIEDKQSHNEYIVSYSYDQLVDANSDKTVKAVVTIRATLVRDGNNFKISSLK